MYLIFAFILLILFVLILICTLDMNLFTTEFYEFNTDKIKKNCRAVLLADLHNHTFGAHNYRLIDAINKLSPDLILIAGDMITSSKREKNENAVELIRRLGEKFPIYYENGNHEHRLKYLDACYGDLYEKYIDSIDCPNLTMLVNETVHLEDYSISISGLELEKEYFKRFHYVNMKDDFLDDKLGKRSEENFHILLAHNPDYFETYDKWGADLILSGHIHGGVVRIPGLGGLISPTYRLFPKYDRGLYKGNQSTMILSSGLGMHTIPIRIFNPAQLLVIDINRKEE